MIKRLQVTRFCRGALAAVIMLGNVNITNAYAVTQRNISVYVDGKGITFDQPPVIDVESNRILVPMRALFESLGYTVEWDSEYGRKNGWQYKNYLPG